MAGGEIQAGSLLLLLYDGTYFQIVAGESGRYGRASNGTTNQTIPANTATTITLSTLVEGTLQLTASRLYADKAGRYLIIARALIGKDATAGQTYLAVKKNGTTEMAAVVRNYTSSEVHSLSLVEDLTLAAGDYMTMTTLSVTGHTVYSDSAYPKCTALILQYLGA